MKTTIFASSLVLIAASSAGAQANNINDHYKDVIVQQPYSVEVCSHGGGNGKSELQNFLEGAIIGGAIGQNITKDLPDGATAGAIIGGILGNQNSTASGNICRTETRYTEQSKTVYSHSTITFVYEGKQYSVNFKK